MNREDVARIWLTNEAIYVELNDGQIGKELFCNYSRLARESESERNNYKLSYFGIHWPDIDEDLSFQGFFNKQVSA